MSECDSCRRSIKFSSWTISWECQHAVCSDCIENTGGVRSGKTPCPVEGCPIYNARKYSKPWWFIESLNEEPQHYSHKRGPKSASIQKHNEQMSIH